MTLSDFRTAAAMRDVMALLVEKTVERQRPSYRYAEIVSVDTTNRRAFVLYPGEVDPVYVPFGQIAVPDGAGQIVRIDGLFGDRFISDIITPYAIPSSENFHNVGATGEPAFQNGWSNYGSGYATAGFYKDQDGWVHLKGLVGAGTNASVIFTLPVGYRPPVVYDSHQLANNSPGQFQVATNGDVRLWNNGTNGFAGMDGISFPTDEAMNADGWQTVPALWEPTTWYERVDSDQTKFYIRDDGLVQMTGVGRADSAPTGRILVIPERARIAKDRRYLFSVCSHNGTAYINARGDIYPVGYVNCEYVQGSATSAVFTFGAMRWWNAEAEPGWIAATLQNSWVNFGVPHSPAGYRKDKYGRVHLRGLIKNGTTTNGTTVLTLPVGFRPSTTRLLFPAETGGSGAQARADVLPDGTVICQLASAGYFSLDNISFRAEG